MSLAPVSVVGVFAGEVAYKDGSKSQFSANLEDPGRAQQQGQAAYLWRSTDGWNVSAKQSAADLQNAPGAGTNAITALLNKLPFISNAIWVPATGTTKTVADYWLRLSLTVALNDGSVLPIGISYQKVGATRQFVFDNNSSSGPPSVTPGYAPASQQLPGNQQYVKGTMSQAMLTYFKQMVQQLVSAAPSFTAV